jgi:hypothetical protein
MRFTRQQTRAFLAIGILLFIVFGSLFAYQQFIVFRMVGTNPKTSKISNLTPYIDIYFSKTLANTIDDFSVQSERDVITGFETKDKHVRVFLHDLLVDETYTLKIPYALATNGALLENLSITFTAKDIPSEKLPKEQLQYMIDSQDDMPAVYNDPILINLPHETLDYEIHARFEDNELKQDVLVLDIRLLLSDSDYRTNPYAAAEKYKKAALDYITSLKLDPNNYTINYIDEPER